VEAKRQNKQKQKGKTESRKGFEPEITLLYSWVSTAIYFAYNGLIHISYIEKFQILSGYLSKDRANKIRE